MRLSHRALSLAVAVALAGWAGVRIWSGTKTYKWIPRITAVAFSADGRWLAAAESSGGVALWRLEHWEQVHRTRLADAGAINALAFSPDGRSVAIAARSLEVWSTVHWRLVRRIGPAGAVYGAARFSPDGQTLATVNAAEKIELWNVGSGVRERVLCCMALYGDVSFSPDGTRLAAAGHWPRIWEIQSGREIRRLVPSRDPAFASIAFAPSGRIVVTGSQDGLDRLWDAESGAVLRSATPRQGYIESVEFDPGGRLVAYHVRNGGVWLWDTATLQETELGPATTSNAAFGGLGEWIGAGAPGGTIQIWGSRNPDSGRVLVFPRF